MSSRSPIRRLPVVVAAMSLGAALVLAGCAEASTEPDRMFDPAVWGVEWVELDVPGPRLAHTDGFWVEFSAAGALWMYNTELRTTLYGTANGVDWVTVDLTEAGLPAEAKPALSSMCDMPRVIDDRGDSFVMVFETYYGGTHPQGITSKLWLPEIATDGEVLALLDSAQIGLEVMPPSEGGWDFRTGCIGGFLELPGGRMIVGGGQWWQPYLTSGYHLYSATESADGTWSVFSSNTPPLGGDNGHPKIIASTVYDGDALMITRPLIDDRSFSVWRSADGRDWQVTRVEAIPDGEFDLSHSFDLVSSEDGSQLVLRGTRRTEAGLVTSVWASGDGVTWERSDFAEGGTVEPVLIASTPSGFVVVFDRGVEASMWTSSDGRDWALSDVELSYRAAFATLHDGGLVQINDNGLYSSGLDWGAAK